MPRFKTKDGIINVPDVPAAISAFKKKYPDAVEIKEEKKAKSSVDPIEEEERKKYIESQPDTTVDQETYDKLMDLYEKAKKKDPTGRIKTKEAEEFQKLYHQKLGKEAARIISTAGRKTKKALAEGRKWWELESNEDGYFGPRTIQYAEKLKALKPEAKKPETKKPAEKTPQEKVDIKQKEAAVNAARKPFTKDYLSPKVADVRAPWWAQDIIGITGDALSLANTRRYQPWQARAQAFMPEATFYDPTRELAANAEQANIQTQGMAAFTGPQALAARSAAIQGQAAKNAADIMARYNNLNVGIANQLSQERANIMNTVSQNQANMDTQLHDKYTIANQQFDNAIAMKTDKLAQRYINAVTNRAKTQALNSMQSNYYTDPSMGGYVSFIGDPNKIKANRPDLTNDYLDALELTGDPNRALEYLKIQKGMTSKGNSGYDETANYLKNQGYPET